MAAGYEADRAEDLQRRDLSLDIVRRQTLRDHVDALWMRQDMSPTLL